MEMEQSLRDSLNQLINIQMQQVQAINTLTQVSADNRNKSLNDSMQSSRFMSSYMTQAPNYLPPMIPFSENTDKAKQKFQNYKNQAAAGPGFLDTIMVNRARVSNEQRNYMNADYASRASNAVLSGGGVFASAVSDIGLTMAAPGLISGLAFGAVGGAAIGSIFDIGVKQNQQNLAYNKYLMKESYRFINTAESTNGRDLAGFSTDQRWEASKFLRHFNAGAKISDNETMNLLQKFTEGGLFKDVKDIETFKDKMTKLTQYVKKSALLLNETFESVTTLMSDMQKVGIDSKNFDYLASKSKVLGSFTGISGSDAMRFTMNTGQTLSQGTNYSAMTMTERVGDSFLYTDAMYDKAKQLRGPKNAAQTNIFNTISNMGGTQNASAIMSQYQNQLASNPLMATLGVNFFDYNKGTNSFMFNPESFKDYLNSGQTLQEASQAATRKLNNMDVAGKSSWMQNRNSYIQNSLSDEDMKKLISRNLNAMKMGSGNDTIRNGDLSSQDMISLLLGDNSNEGKLYGQLLDFYKQDKGALTKSAKLNTMQQNIVADINSGRPGVGYEFGNVWEKFKDSIGDGFTPIGHATTEATQTISDWWYGKSMSQKTVGKNRDFSDDAIKKQGRELTTTLMAGVKQGLEEAKSKGFNVKDDILKMFSVDDASLTDWKNKVIDYKREVFKGIDSMSKDVQKYYSSIKNASDKYGVSETTMTGLLRYGSQTGNFAGLNENMARSLNVSNGSETDKIRAGAKYMGGLITSYGGNQELALAAYLGSQTEVDKALKSSGVADMNMLRNSGYQNQVSSVKYSTIKNYISNNTLQAVDQAGNLILDVDGKNINQQKVVVDNKGKVLSKEQLSKYGDSKLSSFVDYSKFDFEGYKDLYKYVYDNSAILETSSKLANSKTSGQTGLATVGFANIQNNIYSKFAKMYGMEYTPGDTASNKLVSAKMRDTYNDIYGMILDHNGAADKTNSKWGSLSTQDKLMNLSIIKATDLARGENNRNIGNINNYLTSSDISEIQRIQGGDDKFFSGFKTVESLFGDTTGVFGGDTLTYNKAGKNKDATAAKYLSWIVNSGQYEYKTPSGSKIVKSTATLGEAMKQIEKDLNGLTGQEIKKRRDADLMISKISRKEDGFSMKLNIEDQAELRSKMQAALTTGSDDDINALWGKSWKLAGEGKLSLNESNPDYAQIKRAMDMARGLKEVNQNPIRQFKKALEERQGYVEDFGKYGSVLMKYLSNSDEDARTFQSRYASKADGGSLDWNKVTIEDTANLIQSGKQELANKVARIAESPEDTKNLIETMRPVLGETESNKFLSELEAVKKSGSGKNEKLLGFIGELISSLDAGQDEVSKQTEENKKKAGAAEDVASQLDEKYTQLVTQVKTTVDSMSTMQTDLAKRQTALEQENNKSGLFGGLFK